MHPQSRVQSKKAHEVVTTSSPEQTGIPRAMVLTAYFVLSPAIGFVVTVAFGLRRISARSGKRPPPQT
jgi:flagellar biogenesis protein FliO